MHIQFSANGNDITADPYANDDADTVTAWGDDIAVVSIEKDSTGRWSYCGSDVGHQYTIDQLNATFSSWKEALDAFGVDG